MRLKKSSSDKEKEDEENPFTKQTPKHKEIDRFSFKYYLKDLYGSFEHGINKRFGALAGTKFHVRFLRQSKRIIATGYFFLFLMLAFVTTGSGLFFWFFLGAAFLMLDYLWKSRKVAWEKKKQ